MSEVDIGLSMEWVEAEGHLVATYGVQNRSAGTLVVFDRLFLTRRDGSRIVEPDRAYVSVTEERVLRVEKIVPAIPRGRLVESPELPYARLLQAGEVLTGRAVVSVPVLTTPAYGAPATGVRSDRVRTAVFRIGCARLDDKLTVTPVRDLKDVWSVPHAWASERQVVLQGPLIEVDLPVVRPLPQAAGAGRRRG